MYKIIACIECATVLLADVTCDIKQVKGCLTIHDLINCVWLLP